MDKYTGKRLDGRYEIQELIGVGGMAMVYKAHDTVDDTTVAIKILKDEFLGNSEFIRRFKNESKAIAVLSHPNIVKVNDVSFGDKIQYIVMEYIDGITLKEYIGHQHEIPWKEAVHFTVQILQALQHAHEKGIVHRDMKPQNIMLLQDGSIKVTDFGIARFSNNETRTMTDKAIGSVHYIAPEQARGDTTDGKADIYSVGVMLYEMLTGKLPFEADNAVSVAIMQMQNDPTPPREINDKIPEGLEEITLKAMRKEPGQRYASASDMLDAVEMFRKNPSVKFKYSYFVDENPTKIAEKSGTTPPVITEDQYDDDEYEIYEDEAVANRPRNVVKWITAMVAILVVAAIGLLMYMMISSGIRASESKNVEVPEFVGKMYDQIKADKSYKFNFEITADYVEDKPINVVLRQDPAPHSKDVKENATIKLVINSTSTTTEVPKVKNYAENDAIAKLQQKNFNYYVSRVTSAEVQKGYVIDCSPQEGMQLEIGTTVTLIVSDGPGTEKIEVPDVVGMSFDAAQASLEAQGFTTQKSQVPSEKSEGLVVATDPLAGNKLTKGTLVTIQVSDGSKAVTSIKYTLNNFPKNEAAEVRVTVFADGTKIDEFLGVPGENLVRQIEVVPSGATNFQKTITVMIDNIKYQEFIFNFKTREVRQTFLNTNYKPKVEKKVEDSEPDDEESDEEGESSVDSSEDESDTESSREGSTQQASRDSSMSESLAEQIAVSKSNIEYDLNRYYYTDAAYAEGQAIVSEYTEKINSAKTPEEAKRLENTALDKLSKVSRSTTPI